MFAGILVFIGHFFEELSATASKHAFSVRIFSYTLYGFLSHVLSAFFFGTYVWVNGNTFHYNLDALPLFAIRLVTEIIQCEIIYRALVQSERTTFGFARVLTIPILLLFDLAMGYTLSAPQMLGIAGISLASLAYFGIDHKKGDGVHLAVISALLSAVNIAVYKYDITHYNQAMVVQFYMATSVAFFYAIRVAFSVYDRALLVKLREHPLLGLTLLGQSAATLLISLAYTMAPASLILAISRASAVVWSLISGVFLFHEHKVIRKAFVCAVLAAGVMFMVC
jgi:hypothetical protein